MPHNTCKYFSTGKENLRELQDLLQQFLIGDTPYDETQQMGLVKAIISYAQTHIDQKESSAPGGLTACYCECGLAYARKGLQEVMETFSTTENLSELADVISRWYGESFLEGERHCLQCRAVPYYDKPKETLQALM